MFVKGKGKTQKEGGVKKEEGKGERKAGRKGRCLRG